MKIQLEETEYEKIYIINNDSGNVVVKITKTPIIEPFNMNLELKYSEKIAHIDCIYIKENSRCRGNGRRLMYETLNFIKLQKVQHITLQVFPFESTKETLKENKIRLFSFYSQFNFKPIGEEYTDFLYKKA